MRDDETLDDLEFNNYMIYQKKDGFKFGIDSVILSYFASRRDIGIRDNSLVADLGTGTGVLCILLSRKNKIKENSWSRSTA